MRKTYVVGDMHGRFDLLCRTLDLIEEDAGEDGGTFIVLGDFIDRGPSSRLIIDLLMQGPQRPGWNWIILQGNHEAMMLESLRHTPSALRRWMHNGGSRTLQSYGYENGDKILPLKVPEEHLDWLASLPVVHRDGLRIFVHAGVPMDKQPEEVSKDVLQWMLYEGTDDYYDDAYYERDYPHVSGLHIVHGHHQSALHPLLLEHRTNLDSFAWNTGHLAIGVFDGTQAKPIKIMDAIGLPAPGGTWR